MKFAVTLALVLLVSGQLNAKPPTLQNGPGTKAQPYYQAYWAEPWPVKQGPRSYSRFDPANPFRAEKDYKGQSGIDRWFDERYGIELPPRVPIIVTEEVVPGSRQNSDRRNANPARSRSVENAPQEGQSPPHRLQNGPRQSIQRPNGPQGPEIITNPFL